jgi:hypothetical protein
MSEHENLEQTRPSGAPRPGPEPTLPDTLRQLLGNELAGCRIERLLGRGSMGAVFFAYERSLRRYVAIKVLLPKYAEQPEFLLRFESEACAAAGLSSDRIVKVHRHGKEGKFPYVVMEFVGGGTLLQQNDGAPPPIPDVVDQLKQACDGLLAVEEKKLVHRDIKPANIMLTQEKSDKRGKRRRTNLKIVDFGIARPTTSDTSMTQAGMFVGSPLYASPEQWQLDKLTSQSDMYSLGATFYHLITGRAAAAQSRSDDDVREWTLAQPCLRPRTVRSDVPEELDNVIAKMTHRDPKQRYGSFAEIIEALSAIEEGWREKKVIVVEKPAKKWPLLVAAALILGGAVAVNSLWRPVSEGLRAEVLELVAQAGPDGELTKRMRELETLGAEIPETMGSPAVARELQALHASVKARVEALSRLDQEGISTRPAADVDWQALRDRLRPPRNEEDQVVRLQGRVADLKEQDKARQALKELSDAYAALSADTDMLESDLDTLTGNARALLTSCKQRKILAGLVSDAQALVDDVGSQLQSCRRLGECKGQISKALGELVQANGNQIRRLREGLPAVPDATGKCAPIANRLRTRCELVAAVIDAAARVDAKLSEALDPGHELDVDAYLEEVLLAWPEAGAFSEFDESKQWLRRIQRNAAMTMCNAIRRRVEMRGNDAANSLDIAADLAWLGRAKQALEDNRVIAILTLATPCSVGDTLTQAEQSMVEAKQKMDKTKAEITPPKDPQPPGWPEKYRDFAPPGGFGELRATQKGDVYVYGFGKDEVDMLFVPTDPPFLVDVRQVTFKRYKALRPDAPLSPVAVSTLRTASERLDVSVDDLVERDDFLRVAVRPKDAEEYATRAGKELMTDTDWKAIRTLLGAAGPRRSGMMELNKAPLVGPWLGSKLGGFWVGVRDIVRAPPGSKSPYLAVGHSLFEPKDRDAMPILDDKQLAEYYGKADDYPIAADFERSDLGFRCVLRLQKMPSTDAR